MSLPLIGRALAERTKPRNGPEHGVGAACAGSADGSARRAGDPGPDAALWALGSLLRLRPDQAQPGRGVSRPAAVVVLAVLAITTEYEAGMIRTTLAACPRRLTVLAAKALALALVVLGTAAVGVLSGRWSWAGRSLPPTDSRPRPDTNRCRWPTAPHCGPTAARCCTSAWSRCSDSESACHQGHTGGTVTVVLLLLYITPVVAMAVTDPRWKEWIEQVSPMTAGLSIQATMRLDGLPIHRNRLGVLALYAAGATAAGAILFRFRDA